MYIPPLSLIGIARGIGIIMAMFHYPNVSLETGKLTAWAPLEVAVDMMQPSLFAFAMAYFPFDLSWWGNTTLGRPRRCTERTWIYHFM